MMSSASVSIIVPTFNEEGRIGRCLDALIHLFPGREIIIVDGGSEDRTVPIASSYSAAGARTLVTKASRGSQMNAGAAVAAGSALLFVHADVLLPDDAPRWIEETLADSQTVAGAFRTRTVADTGRTRFAPLLKLADLRSRYSALPYGDQALFVRAETFRKIGGFAEIPLMEDVEFARRLRREGRIRTVPACVDVSARRFLARPISSAISMNVFPILFRMGVSPWVLARLYGDPR